jgi:hypothetical protein
MKLTDINTKTLTALLSLTKKKEVLLSKVAEIESEIAALASGETQSAVRVLRAKRGRKAGSAKAAVKTRKSSGSRSPKGFMKEQITSILSAAGEVGVSVKEIAEKIGKPVQNIHVWFASTGKKLGHFERTPEGRYRFSSAPAQPAPTYTPQA